MTGSAVEWISREILPHEPAVRRWLRQGGVSREEEDDLIQEAYSRLWAIEDKAAIASPRSYFFVVVKNLVFEKLRRRRVVRIDAMAEIEFSDIVDEEPSADRRLIARQQLDQVRMLIEELPPRCREVFTLRRMQGLSQRETAARLGVTENIVEKETAKGMRIILAKVGDLELDWRPRRMGGNLRVVKSEEQ